MSSASESSAVARSSRPPSRNARAASWRRLRSRRRTASSSSEPSLAAFCSSERTRRSVPTRSFSPAFIAVARSDFTRSVSVISSDSWWPARPRSRPGRDAPRLRIVRRLALLAAACLLPAPAAEAAIVPTLGNWSRDQQQLVVGDGLLGDLSDGAFHGERPLTRAQLLTARDA